MALGASPSSNVTRKPAKPIKYDGPAHARADFEYVRILHLAASDGERAVEAALAALRTEGTVPQYELVRERVRGPRTPAGVPDVRVRPPDLTCYDRLLGSFSADSEVRS